MNNNEYQELLSTNPEQVNPTEEKNGSLWSKEQMVGENRNPIDRYLNYLVYTNSTGKADNEALLKLKNEAIDYAEKHSEFASLKSMYAYLFTTSLSLAAIFPAILNDNLIPLTLALVTIFQGTYGATCLNELLVWTRSRRFLRKEKHD